ncbi:E4 [Human papillomavirus 154]|uniref:E4 n=1 Tax=Human papillomavirus 154 TaxID=1195796 RepID=R9QDL4_9PAPI|nr:E4 [Human papillomavirus 154]AFL02850.1 E4 [Human papillomavirus 154]
MIIQLHIFCYLQKMLRDMEKQRSGLLILEMNKFFLPLLPALLGGLYPTPLRSTGGPVPPPTPRPKRKTDEDLYNRRRQALALPRTHHQEDDDDEDKENQPPIKDEDELKETEELIQFLLTKLGKAINSYEVQVLHELRDLKKRLRIPQ